VSDVDHVSQEPITRAELVAVMLKTRDILQGLTEAIIVAQAKDSQSGVFDTVSKVLELDMELGRIIQRVGKIGNV